MSACIAFINVLHLSVIVIYKMEYIGVHDFDLSLLQLIDFGKSAR